MPTIRLNILPQCPARLPAPNLNSLISKKGCNLCPPLIYRGSQQTKQKYDYYRTSEKDPQQDSFVFFIEFHIIGFISLCLLTIEEQEIQEEEQLHLDSLQGLICVREEPPGDSPSKPFPYPSEYRHNLAYLYLQTPD